MAPGSKKINEKEVRKHEKKFFRVDVGHNSETREEDKARIDEVFSRANDDVFDQVRHYTVEQFVEEHGLEVDEEPENGVDADTSDDGSSDTKDRE